MTYIEAAKCSFSQITVITLSLYTWLLGTYFTPPQTQPYKLNKNAHTVQPMNERLLHWKPSSHSQS